MINLDVEGKRMAYPAFALDLIISMPIINQGDIIEITLDDEGRVKEYKFHEEGECSEIIKKLRNLWIIITNNRISGEGYWTIREVIGDLMTDFESGKYDRNRGTE